jgi:hypothetical protein
MTYLYTYQPKRPPPWPGPDTAPPQAAQLICNLTNKETKPTTMKKDRKQQEDRLLKRMSISDRRKQLRLRQQIMNDPQFLVV